MITVQMHLYPGEGGKFELAAGVGTIHTMMKNNNYTIVQMISYVK